MILPWHIMPRSNHGCLLIFDRGGSRLLQASSNTVWLDHRTIPNQKKAAEVVLVL